MSKASKPVYYAVCIRNDECEDLELRKVYQVIPDKAAGRDGYLRVIDESGEDYLYPGSYFVPVTIPEGAVQAVAAIC